MFLGELLEWYPKLNDLSTKEFSVDINYKSKNEIYSNLNGEGKRGRVMLAPRIPGGSNLSILGL